jgi:predicted nucleotidyltransferase
MDKRDAIDIAHKYALAIRGKYDCEQIFLFGSYAKGNFNKDSDIDIAVVLNDFENILDIQFELMKIRRSIDSRIEPHPFRLKDFELSNPVVSEIIKYGRIID